MKTRLQRECALVSDPRISIARYGQATVDILRQLPTAATSCEVSTPIDGLARRMHSAPVRPDTFTPIFPNWETGLPYFY